MDGVSAAAAITGLLSALTSTIGFLKSIKDASEYRELLIDELQEHARILSSVKRQAEKASDRTPELKSISEPGGPCDRYLDLVSGLEHKFSKHNKFGRITFVFDRKKIESTLTLLRGRLSAIQACISSDNLETSLRIEDKLDRIQEPGKSLSMYKQENPLVPFPLHQPHFVGRVDELQTLETQLSQSSDVALCGRGGMGKTVTALRYLYNMHHSAEDIAIFWVSAVDRRRFESSYMQILLEIPLDFRSHYRSLAQTEYDTKEESDLHVVRTWLNSPHCGKWIMVLDNADDSSLFDRGEEARAITIRQFLPFAGRGKMLVTSRSPDAARNMVSSEAAIVRLSPMSEEDCALFFRTVVPGDPAYDFEVQALAEQLDHTPLAMRQATGYMHATHCSIGEYRRLFEESESNQRALLERSFPNGFSDQDDPEHKFSVLLTLQMSFEAIEKLNPLACRILKIMAESVALTLPCRLFRYLSLEGQEPTALQLRDALGLLQQFDMIQIIENCYYRIPGVLEASLDFAQVQIHRLVHLAIHTWIGEAEALQWHASLLQVLMAAYVNIYRDAGDYHRAQKFHSVYITHLHWSFIMQLGTTSADLEKFQNTYEKVINDFSAGIEVPGILLDVLGVFMKNVKDELMSWHACAMSISVWLSHFSVLLDEPMVVAQDFDLYLRDLTKLVGFLCSSHGRLNDTRHDSRTLQHQF